MPAYIGALVLLYGRVSDELSKFLGGKATISRPELTSAFWDYVKRNNLQVRHDKSLWLCC